MKFFSAAILLSLAVLGLAGCSGDDSSARGSNANTRARINAVAANANSTNSNVATAVNSNTATVK